MLGVSDMANNITVNNTQPTQFNTTLLKNKKTGEVLTAESVDKKIYKKHLYTSAGVGALVGSLTAETSIRLPNPPKNKLLLRILAPIVGAAGFAELGMYNIWSDKLNKKIGTTNVSNKAIQYHDEGYEIINKTPDKKHNNVYSKIGGVIGGAIGIAKGLKPELKIPAMSFHITKPKFAAALCDGLINALAYAIVLDTASALLPNKKESQTQPKQPELKQQNTINK